MIKRWILVGVAALALCGAAQAQDVTPAPGCQAGIPCKAGSLTIGGATLGGNALAVTGNISTNASVLFGAGSFLRDTGTGVFSFNNAAGTNTFTITATGGGTATFGGSLSTTASGLVVWNGDTSIGRGGAGATLSLGGGDIAVPVAQTLTAQNVLTGTSNTGAPNFTIRAPAGTGTGSGGSLVFQTVPAGTTGTNQNAAATALTIAADKHADFANYVSVPNTSRLGSFSFGGLGFVSDGTFLLGKNAGGQPTFATLGTCSAGNDGAQSWITDSTLTFTSANFGATPAGGGANHVPVRCDGSGTPAWKIG